MGIARLDDRSRKRMFGVWVVSSSPRCPAVSAVSGAEPPPHSPATQIDAEAVTAPGATDAKEKQHRVPLRFHAPAMSTFPVSTHMGHMFLIVRHATGYWLVSFLQRPSGSTVTIFPSGRLSVISQSQVHIPPRRNLHLMADHRACVRGQYAAHARRSGGGRGETAHPALVTLKRVANCVAFALHPRCKRFLAPIVPLRCIGPLLNKGHAT
jgi:hypothetical protein